MARQSIGIGTNVNDGTGDDLRTAMDKVNDNFEELYLRTGSDSITTINFSDNSIIVADDLVLDTQDAGSVLVEAPLIVNGNLTLDGYRIGIGTTTPAYDLDVDGNIRVTGTSILGDDVNVDTITLNAKFVNSILPNTDSAYDLGSGTRQWQNIYLSGALTAATVTTSGNVNVGNLNISSSQIVNEVVGEDISISPTGSGALIVNANTTVSGSLGVDSFRSGYTRASLVDDGILASPLKSIYSYDPDAAGWTLTLPDPTNEGGLISVFTNRSGTYTYDILDYDSSVLATVATSGSKIIFSDGIAWFAI